MLMSSEIGSGDVQGTCQGSTTTQLRFKVKVLIRIDSREPMADRSLPSPLFSGTQRRSRISVGDEAEITAH